MDGGGREERAELIRDRLPLRWLSCRVSISVISANRPPTKSGFYRLGWFQQG